MSAPEYIAGFFLIIIGFAVSELLKGSARLLRERKRVNVYWPYVLVIPFIFEILIFWFIWVYTMIKSEPDQTWSIFEIADISLQVVPWAFISYLIFPSTIKDGFDSRKFYFDNGKLIVIITIVLVGYILFREIVITKVGMNKGLWVMIVSLFLNVIVLLNFKKLHIIWLGVTILLVNYFIFIVKPILIN